MVPIFLGTVLAIQKMQEPQSDLKVKESPSILKDDLSPRIYPFIFTPIPPELLEWPNETNLGFSSTEINKSLPPTVYSVS